MVFTASEKIAGKFVSVVDTSGGADGSEWTLIFNIKNPQTEYVCFKFEYTKAASTLFNVQVARESSEARNATALTDWFCGETWLNEDESIPFNPKHTDAGKWEIFIPIAMCTGRIAIVIVPDVATGADTLVCFAEEVVVRGNR